jgi:putative flippase GtrA
MNHELRREFPASSRTVTPLPETSGLIGSMVRSIRTRGLRYVFVSVVNVVVGGGLLVVFQRWTRPTFANLIAVAVSAIPAYYMNRIWVWGKRGRSHLRKEVMPFWAFTIAGLVISTLAIAYADNHTRNRYLILLVQLASFGLLWVARFFLLDRLFHVEVYEDDTADED